MVRKKAAVKQLSRVCMRIKEIIIGGGPGRRCKQRAVPGHVISD